MGKAVRDDVRAVAAELLDAVRDVPTWEGQPDADARAWWHRKVDSGACDRSACHRDPCWCDPETETAMDGRPHEIREPYSRARKLYDRYRVELDDALPAVGRLLLGDTWVPNETRAGLVRLLSEFVHGGAGPAIVLDDGQLDPKARAILVALDAPAESLAEVADRTRGPSVSRSTVKKLSRALQDAGLVLRNPDGTWVRTVEGTRAMGRASR